jgi:hypothetical protein
MKQQQDKVELKMEIFLVLKIRKEMEKTKLVSDTITVTWSSIDRWERTMSGPIFH